MNAERSFSHRVSMMNSFAKQNFSENKLPGNSQRVLPVIAQENTGLLQKSMECLLTKGAKMQDLCGKLQGRTDQNSVRPVFAFKNMARSQTKFTQVNFSPEFGYDGQRSRHRDGHPLRRSCTGVGKGEKRAWNSVSEDA